MKKHHILILLLLGGLLMCALLMIGDLSNYASIEEAKQSDGKNVSIICRLDSSKPLVYDAINNPNLVSFSIIDSLGGALQVVYHNAKPIDMEKAERLVLEGYFDQEKSLFECDKILMKCPSKYNDDKFALNAKKD